MVLVLEMRLVPYPKNSLSWDASRSHLPLQPVPHARWVLLVLQGTSECLLTRMPRLSQLLAWLQAQGWLEGRLP